MKKIKYDNALDEIVGIQAQAHESGLIGFNFLAMDGAIGVCVSPLKIINGKAVCVGKNDQDYQTSCTLVRKWYYKYHDYSVAECAIWYANDGLGARLFSVELAKCADNGV